MPGIAQSAARRAPSARAGRSELHVTSPARWAALPSEIGCTYVRVGHAERRGLFQEDDDLVGSEAAAAPDAVVPSYALGRRHRRAP
ncbi:triose-phosphate isomerase [Streptomyces sp. CB02414]|uniref:triose-phosphate isomerase n=1 Tax=Streptomyces sp. CB02414 TaxID=1703922 RepID=UPI00237912C5|nr:triose-phosphate isomerase [Streptomyces sp. CB02414]